MDDLVKEICATIEAYKHHANHCYSQDGVNCHVLVAEDNGFELRTTFPRHNFYQSPLDVEKAHGLAGVAGHYKMPKGLKPVELQAYAEILRHAELVGHITTEQMNDKLDQVLGALAARNPKIEKIKLTDDKLSRYNVVLGIASEYNPADIQFFIDAYPEMAGSTPDYGLAWERVRDLQLGWIPAPETIDIIDRQTRPDVAAKAEAKAEKSARCQHKANCR